MRKTAIYRDDLFLAHDPGPGHPESQERLRVIFNELDKLESDSIFIYPQFDPASTDIIELNHSAGLVKQVAATAGRSHGFLDADTQTSADSYDAACLAVGALIDGIHRLDQGEIDNGFCIVRPPGHHAERDRSMGFCLFNNVAVAARWAKKELGYKKIMIVDWDLHHGNGTQHSFYDTDQVLYCSTHQFPYYPGSGAVLETGNGAGEGFTVNVPLSGGQGDFEFARIFNELFAPVARLYQPELLLVSCGFDIYDGDPLGSMTVSPAGFAYMTRVMRELAEELCGGKLLITLEGGYSLTGMRDGAMAVLAELCGEDIPGAALGVKRLESLKTADIGCSQLEQALSVQKNYWKL
ncbi:MAG: histone deacetylase [Desulfobulbaceae bacterium]|nr:histone deacetylase [Desulfobulbaceae bacterium]